MEKLTLDDFMNGQILVFDKPLGWTSFDLVNRVRILLCKYFGVKKMKVGHAGTLDPLATGVLVICTGKKTKEIASIQELSKDYFGLIQLGSNTPTYDLESVPNEFFNTDHVNQSAIDAKQPLFFGSINQYPPAFSAIKLNGKRAYTLARKGEEVILKQRAVNIYSLELKLEEAMQLYFEMSCSSGTYVRSFAYDFGKILNSGGHLIKLVRSSIGPYKCVDAINLDSFIENYSNNKFINVNHS